MAIAAPSLVPALYGPQWTGVVLPLQILCAAGYFRALYHVGGIVTQSVGRVYSELRLQVWYALLVVVGAIVGSRAGLPGVAAGVGVAIVYMFVATGRLVLAITGTSWAEYLRAQRDAIVMSAAVSGFAFIALVMLEWLHARRALTAAGILLAAGVPWAAGVLWILGEPALAPVVLRLPKVLRQLVSIFRRFHPQLRIFGSERSTEIPD
jgi:O-antigen/teichoic acid export membrane protein